MRFLGREARGNARVYFTGGATAVLMGWRDTTIDIDLRFDPELDELACMPLLRAGFCNGSRSQFVDDCAREVGGFGGAAQVASKHFAFGEDF